MSTNEAEITASWERRIDACRDKDIERLMSCYSPAVVYYDVVPPLRFAGTAEVRGNFVRWFDEYDGPIGLETRDASVAASGDVAWAHMLHLDSGKRKNGLDLAIWVRSTVCYQRLDGEWLITHEHVSLPIAPENLQAWFAPGDDPRARPGTPG